jgi:hypothetical protein
MVVAGEAASRRRKNFGKNTIDLQWKMRGNYNARPCAGFRKAAVPRTIENNGKNNAKNNGTVGNPPTSGCGCLGPRHPEAPAFANASAGRLECNRKLHS